MTFRPFIDRPEYTEQVTWYFVPEGTPFLPRGTRFGSGDHPNEDFEWPGPGEVLGKLRVYAPGKAPYVPIIPGAVGTSSQFLEGALWADRGKLFRRIDGQPLQCVGAPFGVMAGGRGHFAGGPVGAMIGGEGIFGARLLIGDGGLSFDGRAIVAASVPTIADGGVAFNGAADLVSSFPAIADGGIAFNGRADLVSSFPAIADGGIAFNGRALVAWGNVTVGEGGLAFDGRAELVSSFPAIADGGIAFNGAADVMSGTVTIGEGGLAFDGRADYVTPFPSIAEGGLAFNGAAEVITGLVIVGEGGLAFNGAAEVITGLVIVGEGGVSFNGTATVITGLVIVGEGGVSFNGTATVTSGVPVTPGSSCAGAATISLNTNYTYSLPAGSHWFKLSATSGTRYKGTFTINSGGNFPSMTGSQGSCPTPINMIFSRSSTGCSDGLAVSTADLFINVQNIGAPTLNYTIRIGTGSCP